MIKIIKTKDYDQMSRKAADIIASQIMMKPDSVLGLATGSSPIGTYRYLIEDYNEGRLDFGKIKTVNLDEYRGLGREDEASYYFFMNTQLFDHVNIDKRNTNIPDGLAEDEQTECERYDSLIDSLGGIDLQVVGIGHNGHIGFNEPAKTFAKRTYTVNLTESTIQANARLFDDVSDVPTQALTMGIKTIMEAKKVLMLISGKDKAAIAREAFMGEITPEVPASILQLHPDVVVVADEEALSEIDMEKDYGL